MEKVYGNDRGGDGDEEQDEEEDDDEGADSGLAAVARAKRAAFTTEAWTPAALGKKKSKESLGTSSTGKSKDKDGAESCAGSIAASALDYQSVADMEQNSGKKKVFDHLKKLDLKEALSGKKLGLMRRHAKEYLDKLQSEEDKVILQNQLNLFDAAVALSPAEIKSLPEHAILENLRTLDVAKLPCPTHVQRHLYKKKVAEAIASLHGCPRDEVIDVTSWWDMVRPYHIGVDQAANFNYKVPCLAAIDEEDDSKRKGFLDCMCLELLLPLVQKGEESGQHTSALLSALLHQLENDMMYDIDEGSLTMLSDLRKYLSGLSSLLSADLVQQVICKDEIMLFKAAMGCNVLVPCVTFAKGVCDVPYYKVKLDAFMSESLSMETHKGKLEFQSKFWKKEGCWQHPDTKLEEVQHSLENLSVLTAALSEDLLGPLRKLASEKCYEWWKNSCKTLFKCVSEGAIKMELIDGFISETSICFPFEQKWSNAKEEIASSMVQAQADQKVRAVMSSTEALSEALNGEDWQDAMARFRDALHEAQGIAFDEASLKSMKALTTKLSGKILACFTNKRDGIEIILDALVYFMNLGGKSQTYQAWFDKASTMHALQKALNGCIKDEIKEVDWNNVPLRQQVAQVWRAKMAMKTGSENGWGGAVAKQLLEDASTLLQHAKQVWQQGAEKCVDSAVKGLAPLAGGMVDGSLWNKDLPDSATWEQVMDVAEKSLKTVKPVELKKKCDGLKQVIQWGCQR
eukprot:6468892-Amphidinium_carterae.3